MTDEAEVPPEGVDERSMRLRDALADANIPTLLLVLQQLTGDALWTSERYRPNRGKPLDDNDSGGLPPEVQDEVRAAVVDAVAAYRDGRLEANIPSPEQIPQMLARALAEDVPAAYGGLLSEEMGFTSRDVEIPHEAVGDGFRVVVIGAGLSGLCMALKLASAGIDFVVLEKDGDLGGTWLENVYPGCGVDTPGHLYSFSFAPNPDITRYFARRDEVHRYFQRLASQHDLKRRIRFGTEVVRASYQSADGNWRIDVKNGDGEPESLTANVLVSAVGMVNRPSIPEIPGLDDFPGPVMHTAAWDTSVDVSGKRVAVIGTGASAMQLVPSIADDAAHVTVFQRSKQWAVPHPNYHREVKDSVRYLMREVPFYLQWYRTESLTSRW